MLFVLAALACRENHVEETPPASQDSGVEDTGALDTGFQLEPVSLKLGERTLSSGDSLSLTTYSAAFFEVEDCSLELTWSHSGGEHLEEDPHARWVRWDTPGTYTLEVSSSDGTLSTQVEVTVQDLAVSLAPTTCASGEAGATLTYAHTWSGSTYGLWYTTDLVNWLPYDLNLAGAEDSFELEVCGLGSGVYFSGSVEDDADQDGLGSATEVWQLGLSDLAFDTDADGVNDGLEDGDGDALVNGLEVLPGCRDALSSPALADSDGDGLGDALDGYPLNSEKALACGERARAEGVFHVQDGAVVSEGDLEGSWEFEIGDHDGDGELDLAVAGEDSDSAGVYLFYGPLVDGQTLADAVFIDSGDDAALTFSPSMVMEDLNGDGLAEIVLAGQDSVHVIDGGAIAATFAGIGSVSVSTIEDINGDGTRELVSFGGGGRGPSDYRVFATPVAGFSGTYADSDAILRLDGASTALVHAFAIGDRELDGIPDLAVSVVAGGRVELRIFDDVALSGSLDLADADLEMTYGYSGSTLGSDLKWGDLDGVPGDDLILSEGLYSSWWAVIPGLSLSEGEIYGQGYSITSDSTEFLTPSIGRRITVEDFDGDGQDDVLISVANNDFVLEPSGGGSGGEDSEITEQGGAYGFYGPFTADRVLTDADFVVTSAVPEDVSYYDVDAVDLDADGVFEVGVCMVDSVNGGYAYGVVALE